MTDEAHELLLCFLLCHKCNALALVVVCTILCLGFVVYDLYKFLSSSKHEAAGEPQTTAPRSTPPLPPRTSCCSATRRSESSARTTDEVTLAWIMATATTSPMSLDSNANISQRKSYTRGSKCVQYAHDGHSVESTRVHSGGETGDAEH